MSIPAVNWAIAQPLKPAQKVVPPTGADFQPVSAIVAPLQHREPFKIGPFSITPFLIDHSAFDSYGFLVEAGNRRIFYSGDLRAHGRKGWSFSDLVARPPANIDALLLEGTPVSDKLAALAEAEATHDTVDACAATGGRATEFVSR